MRKSANRSRRRRAKAAGARGPRRDGPARRSRTPAPRDTRNPHRLLDRILNTAHLARAIPGLPPEVLHRVIQNCGLEDCGELVGLATPSQLARVFDLDLWHPAQPGLDEQFDADRFGLWLAVMMESGATAAAQKLADVDVDLAITGFARHVRVFDLAAISPAGSMDDEEMPDDGPLNDGLACEVGGYRVAARRTDSWDVIVALLTSLDAEHHGYFHRVMRGCRSLSNSTPESDGLDDLLPDREQVTFDLASSRERRREQQGYVTPAQARAFLQMSRQVRRGRDTTPPGNPIAHAYFQALESTETANVNSGPVRLPAASDTPPAPEAPADAVSAIVDMLIDAGILAQPPRASLDGARGPEPRLARIRAHLQSAGERDHAAFSARSQELAFLANTIAAGCSIQARPFTAQEASDAAVATCNLGLENWPTPLPDDFLVGQDLVAVFQIGWTVLHERVCMYAAEQLIGVLKRLRCDDRETQTGLDTLRVEMTRHWKAGAPWRARDALDVMTSLDLPAWAALLGLIDVCPLMHAGIGVAQGLRTREISATAFEFISEERQIASIHQFMRVLPETLR